MVTTRVNGEPFWLGSALRWFSRSSISPCPSRVACGSFFPVSGSIRPSPIRRGLVSASSAFFSSCACRVGNRNRPSLVPSPLSWSERWASARARASSFSSLSPSTASAASGQTTSNSRLPSRLSVGASNTWACSSRCASARTSVPGGRSSYSAVSRSTASVTMPAFSTSITPAASAARVWPNRCVQLGREMQVAVTAGGARPGGVRQPGRRADGSGVGADVVAVGLHQHPQLELLEPVLLPAELHQGLTLLGRGHRPGRNLGEPVQRTRQRGGEPHHRVTRGRLPDGRRRRRGHRGHATHARSPGRPAGERVFEL